MSIGKTAAPVTELRGVGPKTAASLKQMGINTMADLLRHYPLRFVNYPEITEIAALTDEEVGNPIAVHAEAVRELVRRAGTRVQLCTGTFSDGSGEMLATWYHMPYLRNTLRPGRRAVLFGKLNANGKRFELQQPQIFTAEQYEKLLHRPVPQYALPKGIGEKTFASLMEQALALSPPLTDWLPERFLERYELLPEDRAVREIHRPQDMDHFAAARKRIVFDGFFRFLYDVRRMKETVRNEKSDFVFDAKAAMTAFSAGLPFTLTDAQKKVCLEISKDFMSGSVMNRLVQGDVGSGKTAVAAAALFSVWRAGFQGALMAPTEVLARQHFRTLSELFGASEDGPRIGILTGSTKAKERRELLEGLAKGEVDVLIGTHALLEERVVFSALALVVTDEQHRFGVQQRKTLSEKGKQPHVLVMSATPIPRTLAVILYGDLDISVIDARPTGRTPIKNAVIEKKDRPKALLHIKREVESGHQAYIVCPQVEANPLTALENVEDYSAALRESFRGEITVEALHGRMKEAEKQRIMERFLAGEISVLVATTVIEVGVDVPNATVMMIENAERFGLATLHQLRGRVGRGKEQAYCIFVQGKKSREGSERLGLLQRSNDGFEIAAADLKQRGPGELFGAVQSGELTFGLGDIYNDYSVLQLAKEAVDALDQADFDLPVVHKKVVL
nr:ATP-dependent DNA helicase RecG [uncultured Stomatobaculum sp.]